MSELGLKICFWRSDFCPPIDLERVSIGYSQKLHYFLMFADNFSVTCVLEMYWSPPNVIKKMSKK